MIASEAPPGNAAREQGDGRPLSCFGIVNVMKMRCENNFHLSLSFFWILERLPHEVRFPYEICQIMLFVTIGDSEAEGING